MPNNAHIKPGNSLGFSQKYIYDRIGVWAMTLTPSITLGSLNRKPQATSDTRRLQHFSTKSTPTHTYTHLSGICECVYTE